MKTEICMNRTRPRLVVAYLIATFAFAQRGTIPQQLAFTPYHASGIYDIGETVGWTVAPGPVAPTYAYKWTIRRNNAVVLKEGKLDLSSGKDKIEITGDQPEMIYVAVEAYAKLAPDAPAADAAPGNGPGPGSAPAFEGGNTGRNNGSTPSALQSRRRSSASPRRAPMTSTHSGTANSRPRPRYRSTPS